MFLKNLRLLSYFWEVLEPFNSIQELFGGVLANFETSTEFLCYFLKSPEFGRSPEFREQGTALGGSRSRRAAGKYMSRELGAKSKRQKTKGIEIFWSLGPVPSCGRSWPPWPRPRPSRCSPWHRSSRSPPPGQGESYGGIYLYLGTEMSQCPHYWKYSNKKNVTELFQSNFCQKNRAKKEHFNQKNRAKRYFSF